MDAADFSSQPGAQPGPPDFPAQPRAQVSDNLRMLAEALHPALAQLQNILAVRGADGDLPADTRAEAGARLAALVNVLALAGADGAAHMLSMAHDALTANPAEVGRALGSLHDFLDALFDKSGDTDMCDLLLFTACRRLALGAGEDAGSGGIAQARRDAVATIAPDTPPQSDVRSRATGVGRALVALHADGGYRATLDALRQLEMTLAPTPGADLELDFARDFIIRLLDGSQPLEAQALAALDSLGALLAAGLSDPHGVAVPAALLRRRIDFLTAQAAQSAAPGAAEPPQQMLRLMLLADELQVAWDRCASAGATPGRIGIAWQWCETVLRAAALGRRLWPRLRQPGLSGFLDALGRLAFDLAMSPRAEARDREVSSCLIFLEECLRRRLYLEDDFTAQIDCIVDHLALLAYGESEPDPFPWFSRELRADMARRMEGVLEREIQGELEQVQRALEMLWSPVKGDAAPGASPESLSADIRAELALIDDLSSYLRCAPMRAQASELRRHIEANLSATLQPAGEEHDERARRRGDALRAGMVRDLVRLGEMLEQARRSPHNKWRRHPEAAPQAADGTSLAEGIRRTLDAGDTAGEQQIAAPTTPPQRDDQSGAWEPQDDDPEMLGIFLTEARQLLDVLQERLPQLARGEGDIEALTDVRRSFHTFKGSGRMVGLVALSDAAHAIEMLLNACLSAARESGRVALSPAVSALLEQARACLGDWVAELAQQGRSQRQARSLVASALALRGSVAPTSPTGALELNHGASAAPVAAPIKAPAMTPPASPAAATTPLTGEDAKLRGIFLAEARQLFKALRQHGSSWRAKADSGLVTGAPPLYLRAAHTLRGCSAAAGFAGMQQMAAALDDVLEQRKAASSGFDAHELTSVERALVAMSAMLEQYAAGASPEASPQSLQELAALLPGGQSPAPVAAAARTQAADVAVAAATSALGPAAVELQDEIDLDLLPVFLEEGNELMAAVGEGLQQFQRDPADQAALSELRRPLHTVKGSARMAGALRLGHRIHELESGIQRLLAAQVDAPDIGALLALFDHALQQFDALVQLSNMPRPDAGGAPLALPEGERKLATPLVRIKAALLDSLLNQVGEVSISRSQLENEVLALHRSSQELADNIAKLSTQLRDVEIQAEIQIAASHQHSSESARFDPLELDRFTHLQELTRMMAESVNDAASLQKQLLDSASKTQDGLQVQERLTRELQRELMYARMMRFKSLGTRLQHLVRQLAAETGKPLELEIAGGDMEIDRGILERLAGPLEHLLRNAAVHGIEESQARHAAGKQAAGRIAVQAALEGNEAVIRVSDDGRGLDFATIRLRAAELGLPAGDADDAQERARLAELIFEPGLTTTTEVSALAGRGVGMDVVRAEVTALGGRISVQSRPGDGVRFTMHLPLSLAVKQVCLLRHGGQNYAIPSMLIDKVVQLRGEQMQQALARRAVPANGRMAALHSLDSLLDEAPDEGRPAQASIFVMLVKSGDDLAAIMVDHVSGNREVVVKPLGPQLSTLVGVVGATVLGNGEIALIINPLLLARRIGKHRATLRASSRPAAPAQKVVMVVDDSLTVRKVMQRLLAREGYTVATATDGYDAIRQLHDVTPDVFLVDIEMPRMDGFTLVRHLRDNLSTRAKPIVMITSRTGAKHRERAMEVGVNYYLGKPYQDDQLLELLRHYTSSASQRPADDFSDVLY